MIYNDEFFDYELNRFGTKNRKWDYVAERLNNKDVVPLWVADMDFRTPFEVSEALSKRANHSSYGYSYYTEDDLDSFIQYYKRHHNTDILHNQTVLLPSVVTGLKLAVRTLSNEGEGVVIQTPVYGPFSSSVSLNNRVIVENRLISDENNRYSMDLDNLETIFKNGTKLMLLCNPHNPVSRFWSEEELENLLKLVIKYDVTLISDEIHADFVYKPNKFVSMLNVAKKYNYDKLITLFAPSKTFNVAGMKFSMLVTRKPIFLDNVVKEIQKCGIESGNIFGVEAATACYKYCDDWLNGLINYLDKSRKLLQDSLSTLNNCKLSPIEATYLAWLDLREYGFSTEKLISMTEKNGVIFTPGTFFSEKLGEGFLRINFACPYKQLIEGINRLKNCLM